MKTESVLARELAEMMKSPERRTMRAFAETEIVIPDGPFEGRRFRCDRQPFSGLFFSAVEDPYWSRFVSTGPTQSGKTLLCYIIPTLYHLFEMRETVICGLPSMDMAADKWTEDLLPAIEASRYREWLPRSGAGSKGGKSNIRAIHFANGVTLRFMSGGGGDKKRAGYTSRILVITETDGMDESGGRSREADKITQLEARTGAYGRKSRIYMECTVSTKEGRTWREYTAGSQSRVAVRCPHCNHFVTPEREQLVGWQDAEDFLAAGEKAAIICPDCGTLWSEDDRRTANVNCRLVHRGQEVKNDGAVEGALPRTNTLGFRWSCVNNLLKDQAMIGQAEWNASRSGNEDNAEKEMSQFWWAIPYEPQTVDLTVIDHHAVTARVDREHPRGHVPPEASVLVLGTDIGKYLCRWVVAAFRPNASPHLVDYGVIEVPSNAMAEERAIVLALQQFRDEILAKGWDSTSGRRHLRLGFIDARYKRDAVYQFCDESQSIFLPTMGYGTTQRKGVGSGSFPRRGRDQCLALGEEYQAVRRTSGAGVVVEVNADYWKGWVHARLQTPMGQPGALTLFNPEAHEPNCHLSLAKHLTAEKRVEEYVPGKGTVTRWVAVSKNNHYLDATALACVAGHAVGARLLGHEVITLPQVSPTPAAPPSPAAPQSERRDIAPRGDWIPPRPTGWSRR